MYSRAKKLVCVSLAWIILQVSQHWRQKQLLDDVPQTGALKKWCFSVNIAKLVTTAFSIEHLWCLLLWREYWCTENSDEKLFQIHQSFNYEIDESLFVEKIRKFSSPLCFSNKISEVNKEYANFFWPILSFVSRFRTAFPLFQGLPIS